MRRVVVWARFLRTVRVCIGLLSGLDLLFLGLRGCRVYVGLLSGFDFRLSVFDLGWWCLDQGWGFWWGVRLGEWGVGLGYGRGCERSDVLYLYVLYALCLCLCVYVSTFLCVYVSLCLCLWSMVYV